MGLSRRDTIIIAVLINAGLLAILFVTAFNTDDEYLLTDQSEIRQVLAKTEQSQQPLSHSQQPVRDEVDHALRQHHYPTGQRPIKTVPQRVVAASGVAVTSAEVRYVEITVKRGDYLEKIARSNATTIEAIKKANDLSGSQLKIGQVLRVPLLPIQKNVVKNSEQEQQNRGDEAYYIVQSGDNPWTISKKNSVRFSDLLRLNGLDEKKARNLRIGQKLRIR